MISLLVIKLKPSIYAVIIEPKVKLVSDIRKYLLYFCSKPQDILFFFTQKH